MGLKPEERSLLLDAARRAIEAVLAGRDWEPGLEGAPAALLEPGACFVTLEREDALRGCIGTLEAREPLLRAVARAARGAAFGDPRFPPLAPEEWDGVDLNISVLGPSEALAARDEAELCAKLRPRVDGLILNLGRRRATFLPAVWDSLPDPLAFVAQLKRKAGLDADFWSAELAFERYAVEEFS